MQTLFVPTVRKRPLRPGGPCPISCFALLRPRPPRCFDEGFGRKRGHGGASALRSDSRSRRPGGNFCDPFLEVNPRLGGASIFSVPAGANIVSLTTELALDRAIQIPEFREITVIRLHDELVLDQSR